MDHTPEHVELSVRVANVENRLGDVENRLGKVENRLGDVENRLVRVETGLEYLRDDMRVLQDMVAKLAARVDDMDTRHHNDIVNIRVTDFRLMYGTMFGLAVGLAGMMAKGFGWI